MFTKKSKINFILFLARNIFSMVPISQVFHLISQSFSGISFNITYISSFYLKLLELQVTTYFGIFHILSIGRTFEF